MAAPRAHRGNVAWDASKGVIEAMTRAMALDLSRYGVRVNAIVPGLIRTYDIDDATRPNAGRWYRWAGWARPKTLPDGYVSGQPFSETVA